MQHGADEAQRQTVDEAASAKTTAKVGNHHDGSRLAAPTGDARLWHTKAAVMECYPIILKEHLWTLKLCGPEPAITHLACLPCVSGQSMGIDVHTREQPQDLNIVSRPR